MKKPFYILVLVLAASLLLSSLAFAYPFGFSRGAMMGGYGVAGTDGTSGSSPCSGPGIGMMGGLGSSNSMMVIIGEVLDMDWNELREAHWGGKSWTEIAADKGVTKEQLVQAILQARSEYWQQLVDQGNITAEQKEAAEANLQANIENMLDVKMTPGNNRGRGGMMNGTGFGGMMGGFGGARTSW